MLGVPSLSAGDIGRINARLDFITSLWKTHVVINFIFHSRNPLELWKQAYCGFYPQVNTNAVCDVHNLLPVTLSGLGVHSARDS